MVEITQSVLLGIARDGLSSSRLDDKASLASSRISLIRLNTRQDIHLHNQPWSSILLFISQQNSDLIR